MNIFAFLGRNKRDLTGNSDGIMYRYDLGRTGVAKTEALRNLQGQLWEYQCESKTYASPVLAVNTLFLSTDDGCIHAIDANDGKLKWKFAPDIPVSSVGSSCPAIADETVYFNSYDSIYALDVDKGKVKWKFKMPKGGGSSPAVYEKTVFFGCGDYFYAADMRKGKIRWSAELGGVLGSGLSATPAIDTANRLVFCSSGGNIFAFDTKNGTQKFSYDNEDFRTFAPCFSDGLLYVGAYGEGRGRTLKIIEISARNVRELSLGADLIYPVSVDENRIYAPVGLNVLEMWKLSRPNFEVNRIWRARLHEGSFHTSVTVANDVLYIGSNRGLHAINSATGDELWRHDVGESVVSLPLVHNSVVYFITSSGRVIALQ